MAKAKSSKANSGSTQRSTEKLAKGAVLTEEQVNRAEIILEQIEGLADLIVSHVEGIERDGGAFSALNVIKEKATEATAIIRAGFGTLP